MLIVDPCSVRKPRFNNTLYDLSNLMSYSRIFQCQSIAEDSNQLKWYMANFEDNCASLFKWVNATQAQSKLQLTFKLQIELDFKNEYISVMLV